MSGTLVRKIPRSAAEALWNELLAAGFEERSPPAYAAWSAKGPGASVVYYESGKLVVQGKGSADFAASYLSPAGPVGEPPAQDRVLHPVIGSDESGKGDYFGPLIVAAVLIGPDDVAVLDELGVRDSKTVSDRDALRIAEEIEGGYGDRVAVVAIGPQRYNELHTKFGKNLNRLLAWAHARAIEDLLEKHECGHAVVDKFAAEHVVKKALLERGRELSVTQRVRAESHPAVAAASIVARARFLRALARLGRDAGTKLPKGAGWPVDAAAKEIYGSGGEEALAEVAKLHFKTTEKARSAVGRGGG